MENIKKDDKNGTSPLSYLEAPPTLKPYRLSASHPFYGWL